MSSLEAERRMMRARKFKNTTSRARERVRGTGPDRKNCPAFKMLSSVPREAIIELQNFFCDNIFRNDFEEVEVNYNISQHCPLKFAIPSGFQHLLLTKCVENSDPRIEKNYRIWEPSLMQSRFYSWFTQAFPRAFRVRLSLLKAGTEFGWHIDTNTSVACRCSVKLDNSQSVFEVKDKKGIHQVPMEKGKVFFTNTGWPHRVYNLDDQDRLNLVFSIPFESISNWFTKNQNGVYL